MSDQRVGIITFDNLVARDLYALQLKDAESRGMRLAYLDVIRMCEDIDDSLQHGSRIIKRLKRDVMEKVKQ